MNESGLSREELSRSIESVILVASDPVEVGALSELLGISASEVEEICDDLADFYIETDRGFELARVAGGFRFQTTADTFEIVSAYLLEGRSGRLSKAALETLAIVAYKQPISRAQMAAIRGVNVDGVIRTLLERGYVSELGRDPGIGNAVLYGTTSFFLEALGLEDLDDLPSLGDFVPTAEVVEALEHSLRFGSSNLADNLGDAGQPGARRDLRDLTQDSTGPAPAASWSDDSIAEVIDLRPQRGIETEPHGQSRDGSTTSDDRSEGYDQRRPNPHDGP